MKGCVILEKLEFYKSEYIELVVINNSKVNFSEHCHSGNYVITVILKGNVKLKHNNSEKVIHQGELFKIYPYEPHALLSDSQITAVSLCISKKIFRNTHIRYYQKILQETLSEFIPCVNDLECTSDIWNRIYCTALDFFHCEQWENKETFILKSRNEMEKYPELEHNIEYYAQNAYMSKFHFIRKFKEISGLTPHKFLIQNRIRKSQHLLLLGSSMVDTATMTGFYDQSHFNKYFKKIVGLSPTEYVLSIRNFLQDSQ